MAYGNENFEKAYLSVFLLEDGWCDFIGITEDNFHSPINREVFRAIQWLINNGFPADLLTVRERLIETSKFDLVGNEELISITETWSSKDSMAYYGNRLKQESRRSEAVKIASQILRCGEDGQINSGEIIGFADKLLGLNNLDSSEYSLGTIIEDTMEYIGNRQGKSLFGHSFGDNLNFLDKYTKGIQKGRTYRIGAVSNLGKSQLAYNIITNLLDQGTKVAFFTLENEKAFTVTNIMANKERVNSNMVVDGSHMVDFGWLDNHRENFFLIDEEYELSRIFARILEIKPDVVFIDYIGLINITKVKEDEKYTEYARRVQSFVKKTGISLIDLSNLPKDADEDNIRQYGGYYGSSFLRNNTDVGIHMFYYKPFYEWRAKSGLNMSDEIRNIQVITMLISKNRIGTARVEQVFKIDFNKGGLFTPATEQELSMWNF